MLQTINTVAFATISGMLWYGWYQDPERPKSVEYFLYAVSALTLVNVCSLLFY